MAFDTMDSIITCRTAQSTRISNLITLIIDTYDVLHREKDLTPANPVVTKFISILAKQICIPYSPEEVQMVLGNESIIELHRNLLIKLSKSEYLMEHFDSRRLYGQLDTGLSVLQQYENWDKYDSLVRLELEQLSRLHQPEDSDTPIIFVGSGPLPLSAIHMHLLKKVNVICLDIDPDACEASSALLKRIGLGNEIQVVNEDGAKFDYTPFQRIFIASLVTNKPKVLEQIRRSRADSLVAVRTAEGMRQLMYEALDEEMMDNEGWQLEARTSPQGSFLINSTLFYRVKSTKN